MKWTSEAKNALSRIPFFVRKRVRRYVEKEAAHTGTKLIDMAFMKECQGKFLNQGRQEIKGYQVETCFGPAGCPNRAVEHIGMVQRVEEVLSKRDLASFLKKRVKGPLRIHHEFRVSISDCPNACSRPQIADIGLIGAREPEVSENQCKGCGACMDVCAEGAIHLTERKSADPVIDPEKCLKCGQCISICPTGTLTEGRQGYRILIGGKLGRHPQLGKELPGIYAPDEALAVIEQCMDIYQQHCTDGERFGEILNRIGIEKFSPK